MPKSDDPSSHRPRAYEKNSFPWNIQQVPPEAEINGEKVTSSG